jgi:DNA-directed RNA polymerase specialized sigma24 family protein
MNFPTTQGPLPGPRPDDSAGVTEWNRQWADFFHLYHGAMRSCVYSSFRKHGWLSVCSSDVDTIVMNVMGNLYESKAAPVDLERYRLRQTLRMLINRRVVDFIRFKTNLDGCAVVEDEPYAPDPEESDQLYVLLGRAILDILKKKTKSSTNYMIFEMVKIQGRDASEVAAEFGKSTNAIYVSVTRVMDTLREISRRPNLANLLQDKGECFEHVEQVASVSLPQPTLQDLVEDDKLITYLKRSYDVGQKCEQNPDLQKIATQLESVRRTILEKNQLN